MLAQIWKCVFVLEENNGVLQEPLTSCRIPPFKPSRFFLSGEKKSEKQHKMTYQRLTT